MWNMYFFFKIYFTLDLPSLKNEIIYSNVIIIIIHIKITSGFSWVMIYNTIFKHQINSSQSGANEHPDKRERSRLFNSLLLYSD